MGKCNVTASIVLYNNPPDELKNLIDCILNSDLEILLILCDNSPDESRKDICKHSRIIYIHNEINLGFGAAHNIAFNLAEKHGADYHFVINPDVDCNPDILGILIEKIRSNDEIGIVMPKIINRNGSVQLLPKMIPSLFSLMIRVIYPLKVIFRRKFKLYVLEDYYDKELNVPIISGCFSLFNMRILKEIGYYDERFFMYFEDFDLSRRIHSKYRTIYYPAVSIVHSYERGASKNIRLFRIYVTSAIKYFNKHGWFFDRQRKVINRNFLKKLFVC